MTGSTPMQRTIRLITLGAAIAVVAVLIVLRATAITADPDTSLTWSSVFYTDEGWYTGNAVKRTLTGTWLLGFRNLVALMPVVPIIHHLVFSIFGISLAAARYTMVAFVMMLIAVAALMAYRGSRQHYAPLGFLITFALLLLTNYYLFVYGRLALFDLPMFSLGALSLLVLAVAHSVPIRASVPIAVVAGVALAASAFTKTSGVLFVGVALWAQTASVLINRPKKPMTNSIPEFVALAVFAVLFLVILAGLQQWFGDPHLAERHYFFVTRISLNPLRIAQNYYRLRTDIYFHRNLPLLVLALIGVVVTFVGGVRRRRISYVDCLFSGMLIVPILFFGLLSYKAPRYFVGLAVPISYFAVVAVWRITHRFVVRNQRRITFALVAGSLLLIVGVNYWNISHLIRYVAEPKYSLVQLGSAIKYELESRSYTDNSPMVVGDYSPLVVLLGVKQHNVRYNKKLRDDQPEQLYLLEFTDKQTPPGYVPINSYDVLNNYCTGHKLQLLRLEPAEHK